MIEFASLDFFQKMFTQNTSNFTNSIRKKYHMNKIFSLAAVWYSHISFVPINKVKQPDY